MKFMCSYENTWNGSKNPSPHKHLYMKVHSRLIHNCQKLDTIQMLHQLKVSAGWNTNSAVNGASLI